MTTPILTDAAGTTFANTGSGLNGKGTASWPLTLHGPRDKVLMFIQYEPFATAGSIYEHASESRLWQPTPVRIVSASIFTAAVWELVAHQVEDESNLGTLEWAWGPSGFGWTANPDRAVLLSYSHLNSFVQSAVGTSADEYAVSTAASGTLSLTAATNVCGGGDNVAWVVLHGQTNTVITCTWPASCTEIIAYTAGNHTMRIAEQRISGTSNWPAISVPYSGFTSGGFQAVSLARTKPAMRQDRNV